MRKIYFDITKNNTSAASIGIIGSDADAEAIPAGAVLSSMSIKDKNDEYQRLADEYDIQCIFDDNIPQIDFYTIPCVDIIATDSRGGFIGSVANVWDMEGDAPICYIAPDRECFLIASNAAEFLENAAVWQMNMKPYDGITIFSSKEEAESQLDFVTIDDI